MNNYFDSPQKEALDIAVGIRRKLLEGNEDIISVLRNCLVVATNLSRKDDIKWIKNEIEGKFTNIPEYRKINCPDRYNDNLKKCEVPFEIKILYDFSAKEKDLIYEDSQAKIRPVDSRRIIDKVTNKCLFFLNDCIADLQYGGHMQSLFDEIRGEVDKQIGDIDERITQELQSVYINLKSKNPSDYPKVSLSCRKILKYVADKVFPPQDYKYKTKDGREWIVKDSNFRNRLVCFIDRNSGSKIVRGECEMIEIYFKELIEDVQDGVHKDLSLHDAGMIALHTYLVIAEVLSIWSKIVKK